MKKSLIGLLLAIFISINIFSLNYINTAESISWNGAYTSIADGFEAMLYNPTGLFMTDKKFGLNVFGSYGMRFYDNALLSDSFIKGDLRP